MAATLPTGRSHVVGLEAHARSSLGRTDRPQRLGRASYSDDDIRRPGPTAGDVVRSAAHGWSRRDRVTPVSDEAAERILTGRGIGATVIADHTRKGTLRAERRPRAAPLR
jgi:hypothetical protein